MTGWGDDMGFGGGIGPARRVPVDVYTAAVRISGTVETRFSRVTEILNQLSGEHLVVEGASIAEYGAAEPESQVPQALVAVDEILVMVAADLPGSSGEMRIPKHPVRTQLIVPPLQIDGTVHIPIGSRPADGVVHGGERFMAVTDASISSVRHPDLDRVADVLALRRDRAHVILVTEDAKPDDSLAEVLDEATAEAWLRDEEPAER